MKKIVIFTIMIIFILAMTACNDQSMDRGDGTNPVPGADPQDSPAEILLIGHIASIDGNTLTITVTDGHEMVTVYETVIAHLFDETVWEIEQQELKEGQLITLQIGEYIMESFPPQVDVISIYSLTD